MTQNLEGLLQGLLSPKLRQIKERIEMVLQATFMGAIKISVESVAESIISKYALHNRKMWKLNDSTANDEMFIAEYWPELGDADALLAKALDRKFAGQGMGQFLTKNKT